MKNKLLACLTALIFFVSCGTTRYTDSSANAAYATPSELQTAFTDQYPNATNVNWGAYDEAAVPIDWELNEWTPMNNRGHMVSFQMDGEQYMAWYGEDNSWIGSTFTVRDQSQLPTPVQSLISERYSNYTVERVDQEMWKDKVAYEVKLKNENSKVKMLVDGEGNIIKEKTKND
jgi:hypothetical protein